VRLFSPDINKHFLALKHNYGKNWFVPYESTEYALYKDLIDDYEDRYLISPNRRRYLEEKLIKPAVRSKRQFMISRKKIYVKNDVNNVSLVKIRNLKEIAADLDIDWLKVINSQLFDESKVDENEKIFIFGGAQLFKELASNLLESDKG
jgi:hypothetical protein